MVRISSSGKRFLFRGSVDDSEMAGILLKSKHMFGLFISLPGPDCIDGAVEDAQSDASPRLAERFHTEISAWETRLHRANRKSHLPPLVSRCNPTAQKPLPGAHPVYTNAGAAAVAQLYRKRRVLR